MHIVCLVMLPSRSSEMSEPTKTRVRTLESIFASSGSSSELRVLQNDTKISSTEGEQMKRKEVVDKKQ